MWLFLQCVGIISGGLVALGFMCHHFHMLFVMQRVYIAIPGHECVLRLVWVNENTWCHKEDGGITAFAQHAVYFWPLYWRYGEEVHGMLEWDAGRKMPKLVECKP